jgi:hypothetical protein
VENTKNQAFRTFRVSDGRVFVMPQALMPTASGFGVRFFGGQSFRLEEAKVDLFIRRRLRSGDLEDVTGDGVNLTDTVDEASVPGTAGARRWRDGAAARNTHSTAAFAAVELAHVQMPLRPMTPDSDERVIRGRICPPFVVGTSPAQRRLDVGKWARGVLEDAEEGRKRASELRRVARGLEEYADITVDSAAHAPIREALRLVRIDIATAVGVWRRLKKAGDSGRNAHELDAAVYCALVSDEVAAFASPTEMVRAIYPEEDDLWVAQCAEAIRKMLDGQSSAKSKSIVRDRADWAVKTMEARRGQSAGSVRRTRRSRRRH